MQFAQLSVVLSCSDMYHFFSSIKIFERNRFRQSVTVFVFSYVIHRVFICFQDSLTTVFLLYPFLCGVGSVVLSSRPAFAGKRIFNALSTFKALAATRVNGALFDLILLVIYKCRNGHFWCFFVYFCGQKSHFISVKSSML